MVDAGREAAGQAGGILVKGKAGCKDPGPLGAEDQPGSEYVEKGADILADLTAAKPLLSSSAIIAHSVLCHCTEGACLPKFFFPRDALWFWAQSRPHQGQAHCTQELELRTGEAGRDSPAHDATNRGG